MCLKPLILIDVSIPIWSCKYIEIIRQNWCIIICIPVIKKSYWQFDWSNIATTYPKLHPKELELFVLVSVWCVSMKTYYLLCICKLFNFISLTGWWLTNCIMKYKAIQGNPSSSWSYVCNIGFCKDGHNDNMIHLKSDNVLKMWVTIF